MERIVKEKLGDEGLLVHYQVVVNGECGSSKELWIALKEKLNHLLVESVHVTDVDKLRR